jgi:WD40 repeat protein
LRASFAARQATSGICYRTLQYADSQVNKLEITPDKHYLAGTHLTSYRLRRFAPANFCARSDRARLRTAAAGNPAIRLFEVNTNNPQPITSFEGHTNNVTAVGFERDGRWMYSGSEDGTVKIWDLRASGFQREYESRGAVNSVVLHPNQVRCGRCCVTKARVLCAPARVCRTVWLAAGHARAISVGSGAGLRVDEDYLPPQS